MPPLYVAASGCTLRLRKICGEQRLVGARHPAKHHAFRRFEQTAGQAYGLVVQVRFFVIERQVIGAHDRVFIVECVRVLVGSGRPVAGLRPVGRIMSARRWISSASSIGSLLVSKLIAPRCRPFDFERHQAAVKKARCRRVLLAL